MNVKTAATVFSWRVHWTCTFVRIDILSCQETRRFSASASRRSFRLEWCRSPWLVRITTRDLLGWLEKRSFNEMDTSTSEEPIIYTWPDVVTYLVDDPDVYPGYLPPEERCTLSSDYREEMFYDTEFDEDSSASATPFSSPTLTPSPAHDSRTTTSGRSFSQGIRHKRNIRRKLSCKKHILHRDECTHSRRAKLLHKIKAKRQRRREAKAAWYAGPWPARIDIKAIKKAQKKATTKV